MKKIIKNLLLSLIILIIFDQQMIFHDNHIYLVNCRITSTELRLKLQLSVFYSNISIRNNSKYLVLNLM